MHLNQEKDEAKDNLQQFRQLLSHKVLLYPYPSTAVGNTYINQAPTAISYQTQSSIGNAVGGVVTRTATPGVTVNTVGQTSGVTYGAGGLSTGGAYRTTSNVISSPGKVSYGNIGGSRVYTSGPSYAASNIAGATTGGVQYTTTQAAVPVSTTYRTT